MLALMERENQMGEWCPVLNTYPLEVSVNNSPFMDVDQTLSGVSQLGELSDRQ